MKKLLLAIYIVLNLLTVSLIVPAPATAATACNKSDFILKMPTWYEYLEIGPKYNDDCAVIGPLDNKGNFDWPRAASRVGLAIVDILLRVAAIIAVGFVIYGGFQFVLSEGDPEKAKKSRETIFNSLIGLVIVLVSTAAVNFVGRVLIK